MRDIKTKLKTSLSLLGLVVSFFTPLLGLTPLASAAADTCVWTGGGSDDNFSTAANWSGCDNGTVPEAGDTLEFPANMTDLTPTNDMTAGTSFDEITFTGVASTTSAYTISGNAIELINGITHTMTGSSGTYQTISMPITFNGVQTIATGATDISLTGDVILSGNVNLSGVTLSISGDISGSGSLTSNLSNSLNLSGSNTTWAGALTINSGRLYARADSFGTTAGATTFAATSDLNLLICGTNATNTITENLSFTGASSQSTLKKITIYQSACGGFGGSGFYDETFGESATAGMTVDFTGTVTLGSDITFLGKTEYTKFSGTLVGAFKPTMTNGAAGKLVIASATNGWTLPNGTYSAEKITTTLSDDSASTTVSIDGNSEITITGKRGSVYVGSGVLKGTGTVGGIIMAGGTIAPGTSPGCLTSGVLTYTGGTLQIELAGATVCTQYDQQVVTGTVDLGSATVLDTVFLNSYVPALNSTYTIINNDASDAVTGTFSGKADDSRFDVAGVTFEINYNGGDGNDVVLTAVAVPSTASTPDTGVGSLVSSPIAPLISLLFMSGLFIGARKIKN